MDDSAEDSGNGRWNILTRAREVKRERKAALDRLPVELQVKDHEHAKSAEVIQYAISRLTAGDSWEELRRKLGVGASHFDNRWRTVRDRVCDIFIPQSDEDALRAQATGREYYVEKLTSYLGDVEAMVESSLDSEEDRKLIPNFMKLRFEAIRALLDENQRSYEAYTELKKIKKDEHKNLGPSIVIQNNYHVNRPGEIKDVTERVKDIDSRKKINAG